MDSACEAFEPDPDFPELCATCCHPAADHILSALSGSPPGPGPDDPSEAASSSTGAPLPPPLPLPPAQDLLVVFASARVSHLYVRAATRKRPRGLWEDFWRQNGPQDTQVDGRDIPLTPMPGPEPLVWLGDVSPSPTAFHLVWVPRPPRPGASPPSPRVAPFPYQWPRGRHVCGVSVAVHPSGLRLPPPHAAHVAARQIEQAALVDMDALMYVQLIRPVCLAHDVHALAASLEAAQAQARAPEHALRMLCGLAQANFPATARFKAVALDWVVQCATFSRGCFPDIAEQYPQHLQQMAPLCRWLLAHCDSLESALPLAITHTMLFAPDPPEPCLTPKALHEVGSECVAHRLLREATPYVQRCFLGLCLRRAWPPLALAEMQCLCDALPDVPDAEKLECLADGYTQLWHSACQGRLAAAATRKQGLLICRAVCTRLLALGPGADQAAAVLRLVLKGTPKVSMRYWGVVEQMHANLRPTDTRCLALGIAPDIEALCAQAYQASPGDVTTDRVQQMLELLMWAGYSAETSLGLLPDALKHEQLLVLIQASLNMGDAGQRVLHEIEAFEPPRDAFAQLADCLCADGAITRLVQAPEQQSRARAVVETLVVQVLRRLGQAELPHQPLSCIVLPMGSTQRRFSPTLDQALDSSARPLYARLLNPPDSSAAVAMLPDGLLAHVCEGLQKLLDALLTRLEDKDLDLLQLDSIATAASAARNLCPPPFARRLDAAIADCYRHVEHATQEHEAAQSLVQLCVTAARRHAAAGAGPSTDPSPLLTALEELLQVMDDQRRLQRTRQISALSDGGLPVDPALWPYLKALRLAEGSAVLFPVAVRATLEGLPGGATVQDLVAAVVARWQALHAALSTPLGPQDLRSVWPYIREVVCRVWQSERPGAPFMARAREVLAAECELLCRSAGAVVSRGVAERLAQAVEAVLVVHHCHALHRLVGAALCGTVGGLDVAVGGEVAHALARLLHRGAKDPLALPDYVPAVQALEAEVQPLLPAPLQRLLADAKDAVDLLGDGLHAQWDVIGSLVECTVTGPSNLFTLLKTDKFRADNEFLGWKNRTLMTATTAVSTLVTAFQHVRQALRDHLPAAFRGPDARVTLREFAALAGALEAQAPALRTLVAGLHLLDRTEDACQQAILERGFRVMQRGRMRITADGITAVVDRPGGARADEIPAHELAGLPAALALADVRQVMETQGDAMDPGEDSDWERQSFEELIRSRLPWQSRLMRGVERALDWGRQLQDRMRALQEAGHPQHWKQCREQSFAGAVRSLPAQCRALADCLREWEQTLGRDEHKVLSFLPRRLLFTATRALARGDVARLRRCVRYLGCTAGDRALHEAVQGAGHRDNLGHVFADDEGGHMQQMKGLSALLLHLLEAGDWPPAAPEGARPSAALAAPFCPEQELVTIYEAPCDAGCMVEQVMVQLYLHRRSRIPFPCEVLLASPTTTRQQIATFIDRWVYLREHGLATPVGLFAVVDPWQLQPQAQNALTEQLCRAPPLSAAASARRPPVQLIVLSNRPAGAPCAVTAAFRQKVIEVAPDAALRLGSALPSGLHRAFPNVWYVHTAHPCTGKTRAIRLRAARDRLLYSQIPADHEADTAWFVPFLPSGLTEVATPTKPPSRHPHTMPIQRTVPAGAAAAPTGAVESIVLDDAPMACDVDEEPGEGPAPKADPDPAHASAARAAPGAAAAPAGVLESIVLDDAPMACDVEEEPGEGPSPKGDADPVSAACAAPGCALLLHINVASFVNAANLQRFLLKYLVLGCVVSVDPDGDATVHLHDPAVQVFIEIPSEGAPAEGGEVVLQRLPLVRCFRQFRFAEDLSHEFVDVVPSRRHGGLMHRCVRDAAREREFQLTVAALHLFNQAVPTCRCPPFSEPTPGGHRLAEARLRAEVYPQCRPTAVVTAAIRYVAGALRYHVDQPRFFEVCRFAQYVRRVWHGLGFFTSWLFPYPDATPQETFFFEALRFALTQVLLQTAFQVTIRGNMPPAQHDPCMQDYVARFAAVPKWHDMDHYLILFDAGSYRVVTLSARDADAAPLDLLVRGWQNEAARRFFLDALQGDGGCHWKVADARSLAGARGEPGEFVARLVELLQSPLRVLDIEACVRRLQDSQANAARHPIEEFTEGNVMHWLHRALSTIQRLLPGSTLTGQSTIYELQCAIDEWRRDHVAAHFTATVDDVVRMLSINSRFQADLPVFVSGETGCGKTFTLQWMARLQDAAFYPINVHGGLLAHRLKDEPAFRAAVREARRRGRAGDERKVVVLFDEANASPAVGTIKEILCDGFLQGQRLPPNMDLVCVMNPYRKKAPRAQQMAGLLPSQHGDALGNLSLGRPPGLFDDLVYQVYPEAESMLTYVWDWGSPVEHLLPEAEASACVKGGLKFFNLQAGRARLAISAEDVYIASLVMNGCLKKLRPPFADPLLHNGTHCHMVRSVLTALISACQRFLRGVGDPGAPCGEVAMASLRDVDRACRMVVFMLTFFHWRDEAMYRGHRARAPDDVLRQFGDAVCVALYTCYALQFSNDMRLQLARAVVDVWQHVRQHFAGIANPLLGPPPTPAAFARPFVEASQFLCDQLSQVSSVQVVAVNQAFRENTFALWTGIISWKDARAHGKPVPTLLVGRPGSSKTLAMDLLETASNSSGHCFFSHYPMLQKFTLQCTPQTAPGDILELARRAGEYQLSSQSNIAQAKAPSRPVVSVLVLEEIGILLHAAENPLMTLHGLIDHGVDVGPAGADVPDMQPIAIAGLSNWALDASKMSRLQVVFRADPDPQDLALTAQKIVSAICEREGMSVARADTANLLLGERTRQLAAAFRPMVLGEEYSWYYSLRDLYRFLGNLLHHLLTSPARQFLGEDDEPAPTRIDAHSLARALYIECGGYPDPPTMRRWFLTLVGPVVGQAAAEGDCTPARWERGSVGLCNACLRAEVCLRVWQKTGRSALHGARDAAAALLQREYRRLPGAGARMCHACRPGAPLPEIPAIEVVATALADTRGRHVLLFADPDHAAALLASLRLLHGSDVVCGSPYARDMQGPRLATRYLERIRRAMWAGETLVLVHCSAMYESLLDVLNKNYADVAPDAKHVWARFYQAGRSVSVPMARSFRLIIVEPPERLQRRAAGGARVVRSLVPPFLNRLVKVHLSYAAAVQDDRRDLQRQLEAALAAVPAAGAAPEPVGAVWQLLPFRLSAEEFHTLALSAVVTSPAATLHALVFRVIYLLGAKEVLGACLQGLDKAGGLLFQDLAHAYLRRQPHGYLSAMLAHGQAVLAARALAAQVDPAQPAVTRDRPPAPQDDGARGLGAGCLWRFRGLPGSGEGAQDWVCTGGAAGAAAWTVLANRRAARPPNQTDDVAAGYAVGSQWAYYRRSEVALTYVCMRARAGAAAWREVSLQDEAACPWGMAAPEGRREPWSLRLVALMALPHCAPAEFGAALAPALQGLGLRPQVVVLEELRHEAELGSRLEFLEPDEVLVVLAAPGMAASLGHQVAHAMHTIGHKTNAARRHGASHPIHAVIVVPIAGQPEGAAGGFKGYLHPDWHSVYVDAIAPDPARPGIFADLADLIASQPRAFMTTPNLLQLLHKALPDLANALGTCSAERCSQAALQDRVTRRAALLERTLSGTDNTAVAALLERTRRLVIDVLEVAQDPTAAHAEAACPHGGGSTAPQPAVRDPVAATCGPEACPECDFVGDLHDHSRTGCSRDGRQTWLHRALAGDEGWCGVMGLVGDFLERVCGNVFQELYSEVVTAGAEPLLHRDHPAFPLMLQCPHLVSAERAVQVRSRCHARIAGFAPATPPVYAALQFPLGCAPRFPLSPLVVGHVAALTAAPHPPGEGVALACADRFAVLAAPVPLDRASQADLSSDAVVLLLFGRDSACAPTPELVACLLSLVSADDTESLVGQIRSLQQHRGPLTSVASLWAALQASGSDPLPPLDTHASLRCMIGQFLKAAVPRLAVPLSTADAAGAQLWRPLSSLLSFVGGGAGAPDAADAALALAMQALRDGLRLQLLALQVLPAACASRPEVTGLVDALQSGRAAEMGPLLRQCAIAFEQTPGALPEAYSFVARAVAFVPQPEATHKELVSTMCALARRPSRALRSACTRFLATLCLDLLHRHAPVEYVRSALEHYIALPPPASALDPDKCRDVWRLSASLTFSLGLELQKRSNAELLRALLHPQQLPALPREGLHAVVGVVVRHTCAALRAPDPNAAIRAYGLDWGAVEAFLGLLFAAPGPVPVAAEDAALVVLRHLSRHGTDRDFARRAVQDPRHVRWPPGFIDSEAVQALLTPDQCTAHAFLLLGPEVMRCYRLLTASNDPTELPQSCAAALGACLFVREAADVPPGPWAAVPMARLARFAAQQSTRDALHRVLQQALEKVRAEQRQPPVGAAHDPGLAAEVRCKLEEAIAAGDAVTGLLDVVCVAGSVGLYAPPQSLLGSLVQRPAAVEGLWPPGCLHSGHLAAQLRVLLDPRTTHVYLCPNGHVWATDACEYIRSQSTCVTCRAPIGGPQYGVLHPGNRRLDAASKALALGALLDEAAGHAVHPGLSTPLNWNAVGRGAKRLRGRTAACAHAMHAVVTAGLIAGLGPAPAPAAVRVQPDGASATLELLADWLLADLLALAVEWHVSLPHAVVLVVGLLAELAGAALPACTTAQECRAAEDLMCRLLQPTCAGPVATLADCQDRIRRHAAAAPGALAAELGMRDPWLRALTDACPARAALHLNTDLRFQPPVRVVQDLLAGRPDAAATYPCTGAALALLHSPRDQALLCALPRVVGFLGPLFGRLNGTLSEPQALAQSLEQWLRALPPAEGAWWRPRFEAYGAAWADCFQAHVLPQDPILRCRRPAQVRPVLPPGPLHADLPLRLFLPDSHDRSALGVVPQAFYHHAAMAMNRVLAAAGVPAAPGVAAPGAAAGDCLDVAGLLRTFQHRATWAVGLDDAGRPCVVDPAALEQQLSDVLYGHVPLGGEHDPGYPAEFPPLVWQGPSAPLWDTLDREGRAPQRPLLHADLERALRRACDAPAHREALAGALQTAARLAGQLSPEALDGGRVLVAAVLPPADRARVQFFLDRPLVAARLCVSDLRACLAVVWAVTEALPEPMADPLPAGVEEELRLRLHRPPTDLLRRDGRVRALALAALQRMAGERLAVDEELSRRDLVQWPMELLVPHYLEPCLPPEEVEVVTALFEGVDLRFALAMYRFVQAIAVPCGAAGGAGPSAQV